MYEVLWVSGQTLYEASGCRVVYINLCFFSRDKLCTLSILSYIATQTKLCTNLLFCQSTHCTVRTRGLVRQYFTNYFLLTTKVSVRTWLVATVCAIMTPLARLGGELINWVCIRYIDGPFIPFKFRAQVGIFRRALDALTGVWRPWGFYYHARWRRVQYMGGHGADTEKTRQYCSRIGKESR